MHFAEAEQKYRELEDKLLSRELSEDEFVAQANQLRVTDQDGRRWMISGRTGRWLVHDGQQWVFAEPSEELWQSAPPAPAEDGQAAATITAAAPTAPAAAPAPRPSPQAGAPSTLSRFLTAGILGLVLIGCLIGAGISAWVLVLRDLGEATPVPTDATLVSLVETYTPRPVTPTYTPTPTVTPSRTPLPTDTPPATDTPPPTPTSPPPTPTNPPPTPLPTLASTQVSSAPSATSTSSATPSALPPTPTATSVAVTAPPAAQVTYVVEAGDTLWEIAIRFGVSVDALAQANGISNSALIRPGQVLTIPAPGVTSVAVVTNPTPTWTPIVLSTPRTTATPAATATPTPTRSPTPTATRSGPTPTPRPTNTPQPTLTPTQPAAALSGKIAFTVWNPILGKYELYVSRIDGSGRNRLGEGFRQPQFRQDGNLLAVNGDGAPNFEHLVTMNPSGGEMRTVSNYSEDSYPAWSPDGAIVAFSSSSWGDGATRLGIVNDMFGRQQDWIPAGTTEIRGEFPFWMADGRVVYHGCDFLVNHAACGLYWVGAGGGNYQRLTTHNSDTAPAGYGSRAAFMSARDGNWEIYAVNVDSSNLQRLTNNGAQDGLPTWSPDGRSIAFVSNRSGAWAIWVMDANGSNQRKLFDLEGGYGSGDNDWTSERISWAP